MGFSIVAGSSAADIDVASSREASAYILLRAAHKIFGAMRFDDAAPVLEKVIETAEASVFREQEAQRQRNAQQQQMQQRPTKQQTQQHHHHHQLQQQTLGQAQSGGHQQLAGHNVGVSRQHPSMEMSMEMSAQHPSQFAGAMAHHPYSQRMDMSIDMSVHQAAQHNAMSPPHPYTQQMNRSMEMSGQHPHAQLLAAGVPDRAGGWG